VGRSSRLTRRWFLTRAALGAAGVGAASCGWPAQGFGLTAPAGGVLTYWNLFGGGDGVRMVAMQDAFTKANPGVQLEATTLQWGNPYYTKLSMATLAGSPPDVAVMHLARMRELAPAGVLMPLQQADLERHGLLASSFLPLPWRQAHHQGRLYAIPLDTHPLTMYYNVDVCRRAGLLGSDGRLRPITSPEQLLAAFAAAKRVTGAWGLALSHADDAATNWRAFYSLYSQLGGTLLAADGSQVVLDQDRARTVLELLRELTVGRRLTQVGLNYGSAVALFASQKAGFYWEGEWEVTTFQTAKIPFDMTPFPTLYGRPAVQADSHSLVIPTPAQPDPERLDRALAFVRAMLDQSLTWAEGGHIPAWRPTFSSGAYRHLSPQSHYASSADHVVYDPQAWYGGSGSDFENELGEKIGSVLLGLQSPAAAVGQMLDSLRRLASIPPPV
jgi:multiple sugar transport system substrate-binding protein